MYYIDQFVGAAGTSISGWDSSNLPGLTGSPYTVTGSIELDGNGMTFMSSGTSAQALTLATFPAYNPVTASFEVLFDAEQMSNIASAGGVYLMASTGDTMIIVLDYTGSDPQFTVIVNGTGNPNANTWTNIPSVETRWHIKIAFEPGANNVGNMYTYYSTDGINWKNLLTAMGPPVELNPVTIPTSYAVGPVFYGVAGTTTTGTHVGYITAQDVSPASPNCQISNAYVTSSGQSAMLFYETISENTPLYPTGLNFPLTFFQNGTLLNPAEINYWIGSGALCAVFCFLRVFKFMRQTQSHCWRHQAQ